MTDDPRNPWTLGEDRPAREPGEAGEGLEVGEAAQPLHRGAAGERPARPGAERTEAIPAPSANGDPARRETPADEAPGGADPAERTEADQAPVDGGEDGFPGLREDPEPQAGWGKALVSVLAAVLVLGGLYVGLAFWVGSHVPQSTHVRGIDIGGATKEDAAATLRSRLSERTSAPVKVQAGDRELSVDPAQAGLAIDTDRTLDGVTGVSFDPRIVWQRLTGDGADRELVIRVDREKLRSALAAQAGPVRTAPKEGTVAFTQGAVDATESKTGSEVDVEATAAVIEQSWPAAEPVPASLRTLDPKLSQAEIDRFVRETGNTVVSGPVTLTVGSTKVTLDRAKITQVVSVRNEGGKLSPAVDQAALLKLVRAAAPAAETAPRDAAVKLADGAVTITPEKAGSEVDPESLSREFTNAVTRATPRSGTVTLKAKQPKTTAAQLKGMNLKKPMSEFRSRFPLGEENAGRTHNIKVGLGYLDGKVIQPGEQFSLLKMLGAMDESQGYVDAGVIINGMPAKAMAGGLSQVSTVVYNASYFAGVQLDEHRSHSYYIDRYPEGREATIWGGMIDNKWTNDTPSPIVIETFIEGDEVVMRFWGQKMYEVESVKSERYALTQPTKKYNNAVNCEPDHGTAEGFTVTVTRILSKGGKVVKREPDTTTYIPANDVTCTNPNSPGYGK